MPPAAFEPMIPARARTQMYAIDRAVTEIHNNNNNNNNNNNKHNVVVIYVCKYICLYTNANDTMQT
jgi:hypothetical protein